MNLFSLTLLLKIVLPVKAGEVKDMNKLEQLCKYMFDTLNIIPSEYNILICDQPLSDRNKRVEIAE